MSQSQSDKVSKYLPGSQHGASLLNAQEKLSARQAKRAAKAAERRENSDALKEEGNTFFRKGDYQNAIDRYRQAISVHGPSVKPILLTNLAAAYHNAGKFYEAHETADEALTADPKSVKARYRRAMARKSMEMWSAAAIDFRIVLQLDPKCQQVKKELTYVEKCCEENRPFLDEETEDRYSEDEAPAPDDDPQLGESLSESSDCEHSGNGKPCKFYNHIECTKGRACQFSHAPDYHSERDALGRNVCKYYLMDLCKFGERCSYLHSKEYLLQKGWWSTAQGTNKAKNLYKVRQMFKKAAIDYEKQSKTSPNPETAPAPKKKYSRGKKNGNHRARSDFGRSEFGANAATSVDPSILAVSGQSSRKTNLNNQTKYTVDTYPEGYDSNDGDEDDYGMFGFTNSQMDELLCQGVKPWDDDAWDVLEALHSAY